MPASSLPSRRLSVAPMLDWTDRHYRFMARQITRNAWLYSEMVNSGAVVYGDKDRFLSFNEGEQPVALQLGGSDPHDLAIAAKAAEAYGYNEVNLNCGCPSSRVQKGAFGACLMNDVDLVADCLNAMQDAVEIPVTVKHRIGVDRQNIKLWQILWERFAKKQPAAHLSSMHAMLGWTVYPQKKTAKSRHSNMNTSTA